MEQGSSWADNRFSANPEISRILWNPKVHYRFHTCSPPVPMLCQLDTVHTSTSYFLKIHLNIILSSMPGSSKWSLSVRCPHPSPVWTFPLPSTCYTPRPSHSSWFYHTNNFGEEYRSLSSSLCSFLHSPVTFSLLGPNIFHRTVFSNTLNVSDQVSHPYKTPGKIIVLCILTFQFLDSEPEDKRFCTD